MVEQSEGRNEWTISTLYSYMITRFTSIEQLLEERKQAQNEAMKAALAAAEKAVVKAEIATEKRFDSVNEFRQTLADQQGLFIPRAEYQATINALHVRLEEIKARVDKQEGKGLGLNAGWIYLLGAIATVGTIFAILLR